MSFKTTSVVFRLFSVFILLISRFNIQGGTSTVSAGNGVWISNGPISASVKTIAIDPWTPTTIYAGTDGNGVFKSVNGGEQWDASNMGLTDAHVETLVINPLTPSLLYVGTHDTGVFKSLDGGENWSPINTGLTCPYIFALAIDPTTPSTIYAGTLCGMFKSIDGGEDWYAI